MEKQNLKSIPPFQCTWNYFALAAADFSKQASNGQTVQEPYDDSKDHVNIGMGIWSSEERLWRKRTRIRRT